MRTLVALVVFTMLFGFFLAFGLGSEAAWPPPLNGQATDAFSQSFGPWGTGGDQSGFQPFGGPGTDLSPWFTGTAPAGGNNMWTSGISEFQNFSGGMERPPLEPNLFDGWNLPYYVNTDGCESEPVQHSS